MFDPHRQAILLVGGDKTGQWQRWYQTAIPRAEELYDAYLADIADHTNRPTTDR